METYLHKIEYLVRNAEEISRMKKIIKELPIEIPFHTTMVLELNQLPKESFPYEMTVYLDKKSERIGLEEYAELRQKYDSKELNLEIRACANKIDKNFLLHEVKTTDESCEILPEEISEGVMVVYGNKDSPTKVYLTFWEGAYSEFL